MQANNEKTFKCLNCGEIHKNKVAIDDCKKQIIKVSNKTYKLN